MNSFVESGMMMVILMSGEHWRHIVRIIMMTWSMVTATTVPPVLLLLLLTTKSGMINIQQTIHISF